MVTQVSVSARLHWNVAPEVVVLLLPSSTTLPADRSPEAGEVTAPVPTLNAYVVAGDRFPAQSRARTVRVCGPSAVGAMCATTLPPSLATTRLSVRLVVS